MAEIRPFCCIRPAEQLAKRVAALPYDVYNRQEAKQEVLREPLSFLKIDRAETSFPDSVDTYAPEVYQKAKELLEQDIEDGVYVEDGDRSYYVYQLVMDGRAQTGLVACSSVDDYMNNVIKKHENTRADKEVDRITHVDTCSAQTGPIFWHIGLTMQSIKLSAGIRRRRLCTILQPLTALRTGFGRLMTGRMWTRFTMRFARSTASISRTGITGRRLP